MLMERASVNQCRKFSRFTLRLLSVTGTVVTTDEGLGLDAIGVQSGRGGDAPRRTFRHGLTSGPGGTHELNDSSVRLIWDKWE